MNEYLIYSLLIVLAFALAIASVGVLFGFANAANSKLSGGISYVIGFAMVAASTFIDAAANGMGGSLMAAVRSGPVPGLIWLKRAITVGLICYAVSLVVVRMLGRNGRTPSPLVVSGVFYLISVNGVSAVAGETGEAQFAYFYALPVMLAWGLMRENERHLYLRGVSLGVSSVLGASLLALIVLPDYALTRSFTTLLGFVGGRLNGVTSHPNTLGQIAILGFLLAFFFEKKESFRWVGIVLALACIGLAQSKTAVLVFAVVVGMIAVRYFVGAYSSSSLSYQARSGILAFGLFVVSLLTGILMLGVGVDRIARAATDSVPGLSTLTGRTDIWSATLSEFVRNPLTGYGPTIWDPAFRASRGFIEVGQAHNQFVHTLGAGGIIGFVGLVSMLVIAMYSAFRRVLRDLDWFPITLLVALILMCVSESPLRFEHPLTVGALLWWVFLAAMIPSASSLPESGQNGSRMA